MRNHSDSDTHGGRARSGAVLSIVPADGPPLDGIPAGGGGLVPPRTNHPAGRKRATGPRPVLPAAVGSRPALGPVPVRTVPSLPEQEWAGRAQEAQRVLERRPVRVPEPLAWKFRVRRAVAGVLAVLVTAAVVVALGLLADAASAGRHAAAVERTVTADSLTSVQGAPGQVLRVPVR